jgi:hydrogenase-1 operon protein HyaF
MKESTLVWHPKVPSGESGGIEDVPRLIGMPTGLVRPARQIMAAETLSPAAKQALRNALEALRRHAESPGEPTRISLKGMSDDELGTLADVLGEGDIWAQVGGNAAWHIVESVLTGLWRIEAAEADGSRAEWLEVGAIPQVILAATERMPRDQITIPTQLPPGAMNVLALLNELQERVAAWEPGQENHVINFTLLPITDVDAEVLTAVLGQIPLIIRSGGYGSCRIFGTGLKRVWAVQYLNSIGKVILDTLEIGGIPAAALAAREDFEDSAMRLTEILDAYSA